MKNVTTLTLELPPDTASLLRGDLESVGWRTDEFDAKTWLMRGPEFRIMVLVQPKAARARLTSIGFETNDLPNLSETGSCCTLHRCPLRWKQVWWIIFK